MFAQLILVCSSVFSQFMIALIHSSSLMPLLCCQSVWTFFFCSKITICWCNHYFITRIISYNSINFIINSISWLLRSLIVSGLFLCFSFVCFTLFLPSSLRWNSFSHFDGEDVFIFVSLFSFAGANIFIPWYSWWRNICDLTYGSTFPWRRRRWWWSTCWFEIVFDVVDGGSLSFDLSTLIYLFIDHVIELSWGENYFHIHFLFHFSAVCTLSSSFRWISAITFFKRAISWSLLKLSL